MQSRLSPRLRLAVAFLVVNALGWAALVAQRSRTASRQADPVLLCTSADQIAELAGRTPWIWYFSHPMCTPEQVGQALDVPPASLSPRVPGTFVWGAEDELHYQPSVDWPDSTELVASFGRDLHATDGERVRMSGDLFRMPTARLRLVRLNDGGPTDDNAARQVWMIFNQPPDPAALERSLAVKTPAGEPLPATLTDRLGHDGAARLVKVTLDPLRVERLVVTLDASILRAARGTLPPAETQVGELTLQPGLAITEVETESPGFGDGRIRLGFTRSVSPDAIRSFLRVSPAVPFSVAHAYSWWDSRIDLTGPFVPGVPYTVTAQAGLPARTVDGEVPARLPAAVVRRVIFNDRPASVAFPDEGRHLTSSHPLRVTVRSVNAGEVELRLDRIRTQNLAAFAREDRKFADWSWRSEADAAESLTGRVATRVIRPGGAPNTPVDSVVDLREWLPADARPGIYLVVATAKRPASDAQSWRRTDAERVVVVSDLGLSARVASDRVLVWATSLGTAAPLDRVRLSLLSETNDRLAEGTTGADGVAELRLASVDASDPPLVLVAERDGDTTFLPLSRTYESTASLRPPRDARGYATTPYEAFVFTDRGIYRPGEKLHAKAILRDERNQPPGAFPVRFRLRRPDGRVAAEATVTLSDLATAETSFAFAPEWPTGPYGVELSLPADDARLGAATVSLEEIVPPQIAVDLTAPEGRHPTRRILAFTVAARHLFGAPAAGLPCEAQVRFEAADFAPEAWSGFRFGDASKPFVPQMVSLTATVLDADGKAEYAASAQAAWRPPAALRATLLASVQQSGGRTVVATATRPVDPYPFYIGVKPSRDPQGLRANVAETLELALVAPDGTAATETPAAVAMKLERLSRSSVLRRQTDGSYRYVTETLTDAIDARDVALESGRATLPLELLSAGEYRLTFADTATGASTSLELEASALGDQWAHTGTATPDVIQLEPDKPAYAPGDTARLTVKAPFPGLALVTIEGRATLRHELRSLTNTAAVLEVPLPRETSVPSVHVALCVVRPAEAEARWSAHRANGAALLRVVAPERALTLALDAPAEMRPAALLAVGVLVRDAAGHPATNVEVTVAAVDEALCLLTSFQTPDPLGWFNAPRLAGIRQYDLFGRLLPVLGGGLPVRVSHVAGDGGVPIAPRLNPIRTPRFRTVALWEGAIRTDAQGRATARFAVPEFTGALRVMAVAAGVSAYGSATGSTHVKRPVVVQSSLPRFVAPGDRFTGTVELFNETDREQRPSLSATASGALILDDCPAVPPLAAHARRVVRLAFRAAETPGVGRVELAVSSPEADSDYRESFDLPVRPAAPLATTAFAGRLAPGESLPIEAPEELLKGTRRVRVVCGPRPEGGLGESLEYLLRYPYGCLEQTVSSAFPLLYFDDLARSLRPDLFVDGQARDFVAAGVGRVLAMQRSDGAFSPWPRHGETYAWGGVYATHFLVEARKAGHAVAEYPLKAALDHLAGVLRGAPVASGADGAWEEDMRRRAYACHVLALAGRPDDARSWTDRLFELAKELPHDARADLAAALRQSGRPREAAAVLRASPPPAAAYRLFGGSLSSDVRDTALLLSAWCDVDPAAPELPALAARLERVRTRGAWRSTQDNAIALMALGKFHRAMPADRRGYRGTLSVGDAAPVTFTQDQTFRWQSPDSAADAALRLRNEGLGTLFYSVRVEGVPLRPAREPLARGVGIRREWLDVNTGLPLEPRPDGAYELAQGTLIAVRLTLDVAADADQLVVADLLPAGLELENPALHTSAARPVWMPRPEHGWVSHQELRDDRLLLFTRGIHGTRIFHYTARAVTPGDYVVPAAEVEAMYDSDCRGRTAPARLVVR